MVACLTGMGNQIHIKTQSEKRGGTGRPIAPHGIANGAALFEEPGKGRRRKELASKSDMRWVKGLANESVI